MKFINRWQVLKENIKSLVKDLFDDGAVADLDDDEKVILLEAKWIEATYTRFKFTSKGQKEFLKIIKDMYKRNRGKIDKPRAS